MRDYSKVVFFLFWLSKFVFLLSGHCLYAQANTNTDNNQQEKKNTPTYKHRSLWINPIKLLQAEISGDTFQIDRTRGHRWNETDTMQGFIQTLGLIGKSYNQYHYGLAASYLSNYEYIDPLTNQPNVYIINPQTQLYFYDTYTPYFLVAFDQSAFDTQLLTAHAAMNINPYWNTSIRYRRRSAIGPYRNTTTDHYNMSLAQYWRTFNKRYHAFLSLGFNQLRDRQNGGTFQDGTVPFEASFNQLAQPVWFTNANSLAIVRSIATHHLYHFRPDTFAQQFSTSLNLTFHDQVFHFSDPNVYRAESWENINNRPYGNFYFDSSTVNEGWLGKQLISNATFHYKLKKQNLQVQLNPAFRIQYFKPDENLAFSPQRKNAFILNGQAQFFNHLKVNGELAYTRNNLLANENNISLQVQYTKPDTLYALSDTVTRNRKKVIRNFNTLYRPYKLEVAYAYENKNPSLLNVFWQGFSFRGNRALSNESIQRLTAEFAIYGKPKFKKAVPFRPMYLSLKPFISQVRDIIFYNERAQVQQIQGTNLSWYGLNLSGLARLGRFYLDANCTLQASDYTHESVHRYAKSLPAYYGQMRLYFEGPLIPNAEPVFYFGIEHHSFSSYQGLQYEPLTRVFYPQTDYTIRAYPRFDVVVAAQVKSAYVYLKFIHINEGVLAPGYYTTAFYPMLPRSLSFGLKWTFYD